MVLYMPRVSAAAIQRDREASRARYHKNSEQRLKGKRQYLDRKFESRPFIGWDSEGYNAYAVDNNGNCAVLPQRTMLFGCSVRGGECITGIDLSSQDMFDFLLRIEAEFPDAFHVGFAFEYDINQMLKDLPWRMLAVLKQTGKVRWKGYRISHVPHKLITISKDGVVATIYDGFGFFHCKYETALTKYGIGSESIRTRIHRGKSSRGHFSYSELPEVKAYWQAEIGLYPELFECVRDAAYMAGFRINAWHGPGALASFALRHNDVLRYRSKENVPPYVKAAIRYAYCGGRFQAWQSGWYEGPIFTLDKNSAYVQAIAELPRLDNGKWVRCDPSDIKGPDDIARFGLYRIHFDDHDTGRQSSVRSKGMPDRPYPLFHRDANGRLTWPDRTTGWYWSPEAKIVAGNPHAKFAECFVYQDDGTYPFEWVNDAYQARLWLQGQGNPAEKAFKWALAALYGAFARRVGWDKKTKKAPRTHELAWAGYITSHCRAAIYDVAAYAHSKGGLISVDTDGVMATVPFPESIVPEGFGTGLGQWKQDEYSAMLYWQNGIYWLRDMEGEWKEAKSRGVPRGVIPLEDALSVLESASFKPPFVPPKIVTYKTRYIGYRAALGGHRFGEWRVWKREKNEIIFGGQGKGTHLPPFCVACRSGAGLHTITHLPPRDPYSHEHKLPWLEPDQSYTELGSDFLGTEEDIFAAEDLEDRL